jgi:hypothetical protein
MNFRNMMLAFVAFVVFAGAVTPANAMTHHHRRHHRVHRHK